jgi:hypothetical protein
MVSGAAMPRKTIRLASAIPVILHWTYLSMLAAGDRYHAQEEEWRRERERKLTAELGWLSVAGLFWLKEGANTAGSAPGLDIVLPSGPQRLGVFHLDAGRTRFAAEPGVRVLHQGRETGDVALRTDREGPPDRIAFDRLTLHVIHRGSRFGLRLTDSNSRFRRQFAGLRWFPVDPRYRVTARFYPAPKRIPVPDILGGIERQESPGYVEFQLEGRALRLEPVWSEKRLFFVLKDQTAGAETYPAGRFLYTDPPRDGRVLLDFNRTENPPCAFTPYATCPLPPRQNHLPIPIRAGERKYPQSAH